MSLVCRARPVRAVTQRLAALTAGLVCSSLFPVQIDHGPQDYQLSKQAGDAQPTIVSQDERWQGIIAYTASLPRLATHELVFEFETPDYFSADNQGHFAAAVRADALTDATGDGHPNARGRGIIIGNVTGYAKHQPPCGPTEHHSVVAMEAFWANGNCVFGASTESPALDNNIRYRLHIISRLPRWYSRRVRNEYQLWQQSDDGEWERLFDASYLEVPGSTTANPSPLNLGGIFLGEAFSTHAWTVHIDNLTTYRCAYGRAQCSKR